MRKLLWSTIGFSVACVLCAYRLLPGKMGLPAAAAAMLLILPAFLLRDSMHWRRLGALALGCAAGLLWFQGFSALYLAPAEETDGKVQHTVVTARDYSWSNSYGSSVDGTVTLKDRQYAVRVYLDEEISVTPGDRLTGSFRFRLTTPQGEEASAYHPGKGIFLLLYQEDTLIHLDGELTWSCIGAWLRRLIRDRIDLLFPEDAAPFLRALLLGDSTLLDYETDTALQISGIRHVIAVSGLHVSLVYGVICTLTARRRYLTALLGIPVLVLFAAVVGFTPSVNRACLMVGLMMLSGVFQREYDPPTALGFAVAVMLLGNPLAITSVSLQLSALCVAGILLFQNGIRETLLKYLPGGKGLAGRIRSWLVSSISITVSAMSLTTPLSAVYFGMVSLIGIVTNLLTLWVVTFIFTAAMGILALSFLCLGPARLLGSFLAWPVRYVLWMARLLSRVPAAAVYTGSIYIVFWLIFVYLLLGAFVAQGKKQAGNVIGCGLIGLCVALLCSWTEPLVDCARITMLDVGQGQSILLQSGRRTFLVDCGGSGEADTADAVAQTLLSQGIRTLDALILTHPDTDHAGAADELLTRIDAKCILVPVSAEEASFPGSREIGPGEDVTLSFEGGSLTVFGPIYPGGGNENSLCVLFDTEKCDILITGDRSEFGERMLLRRVTLPDVDILVAGHHGAADSTGTDLLEAVKPETVLISAGENNPFGHPAPDLLQRLRQYGCDIYRTDLQGTVIIRR